MGGPLVVLFAATMLGLNVHQSTDVGLDISRDANVKWVRIDFNWVNAQPTNTTPDFTLFDTLIDNAKARNLEVLAVIGYGPSWASTGDTKGDGSTNDVPNVAPWSAFVTASVNRYKNRVTHWEIWNEPNLGDFFEGTPQQYIDNVLNPGADAVHAACSTCKVVGPGLASIGGQYAVWLEAVLGQSKSKLDIISGHIYAGFGGGVTADNFFQKLESHRKIVAGGVTIYEGPLSFREVMLKHGATQPFWLTETGLEAPLGDTAKETAQADFYRQVIQEMYPRPWWTHTIFYEAFDESAAPYRWGVALHDDAVALKYRPKAVFNVLKNPPAPPPPDMSVAPVGDGGVIDDAGASADDMTTPDPGTGGPGSGGSPGGCDMGSGASGSLWIGLALTVLSVIGHRATRKRKQRPGC
jgi:hypothetical protein